MLYCPKCKKEVVIFGVSSGASDADEIAKSARDAAEKDGKLILFNPPRFGPYTCPNFCMTKLVEKKGK